MCWHFHICSQINNPLHNYKLQFGIKFKAGTTSPLPCHSVTHTHAVPGAPIIESTINSSILPPLTQSQLPPTISSQERKGPHLQGSGPSATAHSNTKAKKRRKKKQHSLLSFSLSYLPSLSCLLSSGGFCSAASSLVQKPN